MKLSEEQLKELEEFAGAFMKIDEICIIMDLDPDAFRAALQDHSSPVYKAHQKGYLQAKYQVNRKIIDLATAGSSPAQTLSMKLIQDKELEDEG